MQSVKLLKGDCLELMKDIPDKSIDAVVTDPPYNISRENHFSSMGRSGIDFGEWDKGFDQASYLNEVFRVLKKGGDSSYIQQSTKCWFFEQVCGRTQFIIQGCYLLG